jgi:hypothetical protein
MYDKLHEIEYLGAVLAKVQKFLLPIVFGSEYLNILKMFESVYDSKIKVV